MTQETKMDLALSPAKEVTVISNFDYAAKMKDFKEKNKGFDLDYVDMGTYLKINSKGQFYEADDDKKIYDSLDAVIVSGEPQFVLWGKEETPEEGKLLISQKTQEEAEEQFEEIAANGSVEMFGQLYDKSDIAQRYIITFMTAEGKLYAVNMSKSSKKNFGKYSKSIYLDKDLGLQEVLTRISTVAMSYEKNHWNAVSFELIEKI